ncbi:unnamed protein product [Penicillium pancosmium]
MTPREEPPRSLYQVRCIFEDNTNTCSNCQRHQWPCLVYSDEHASQRERKRKRQRNPDSVPHVTTREDRIRRRRLSQTEGQHGDISATGTVDISLGEISENDATHIDLLHEQTPTTYVESGSASSAIAAQTGISDEIASENPYLSAPIMSFMARSRYFDDTLIINEDQARSYPIGDADGPTEDDHQLLRLQGAFELPPRAVRDGLINTFMERCSPWMPIVERSWLEESGSQKPSMLLLQAIFVAASRVTSAPAVTAYASTHQFYRRAKALFWSGYEKNPLTVVAAVCILHWYNPEGPEHVSTNTSGFWRYVGVGLAHQIGLQKEPMDRKDAALRRRLWWTLFARDCLISAGQGRPLAVCIEDCELAPPYMGDFQDSSSSGSLFIAYVEISSILGHLTQHCRRKTLTRQTRQNIENQLYRWTRELPGSLRLFQPSTRPQELRDPPQSMLSPYSFEARQLHIAYFICLAILCRPSQKSSPSPAVVLASSFVAGMFEDFLARDEIQFLGPIFTFHLLASGIGLLSIRKIPSLWEKAVYSLKTIYLSLEVLAQRWSSAKGSLRALKSIASEQEGTTRPDDEAQIVLPREHYPFFQGFGPDISWAWPYFMHSTTDSMSEDTAYPAGDAGNISLDTFNEAHTSTTEEYRPLTTILDPHTGLVMGGMTQSIGDDFFHNQYQGMGDWLFKDLNWAGDTPW